LAAKANALDDAEADARELLNSANNPKDWNYGNAILFGNRVPGQVALRRGDAKESWQDLGLPATELIWSQYVARPTTCWRPESVNR
jgi:hypothetical protein